MGEEEGEGSVSVYDTMVSWFKPSYLFIFINLVIGTIAITSRFANSRKQKQPNSPIERVTSFGLGCYKFEPAKTVETCDQTVVEPVKNQEPTRIERAPSVKNQEPARIERAPSLLDRVQTVVEPVKNQEPTRIERAPSVKNQEPARIERAPSLLDRVQTVVEPVKNQEPTRIERAPSLLDRVKSINLGFYKTEDPVCDDPNPPIQNPLVRASSLLERVMSVTFQREKKSEPENMDGRCEDEEVDAKADDFIKKFKQQLKLERLDSILRYRDILPRK